MHTPPTPSGSSRANSASSTDSQDETAKAGKKEGVTRDQRKTTKGEKAGKTSGLFSNLKSNGRSIFARKFSKIKEEPERSMPRQQSRSSSKADSLNPMENAPTTSTDEMFNEAMRGMAERHGSQGKDGDRAEDEKAESEVHTAFRSNHGNVPIRTPVKKSSEEYKLTYDTDSAYTFPEAPDSITGQYPDIRSNATSVDYEEEKWGQDPSTNLEPGYAPEDRTNQWVENQRTSNNNHELYDEDDEEEYYEDSLEDPNEHRSVSQSSMQEDDYNFDETRSIQSDITDRDDIVDKDGYLGDDETSEIDAPRQKRKRTTSAEPGTEKTRTSWRREEYQETGSNRQAGWQRRKTSRRTEQHTSETTSGNYSRARRNRESLYEAAKQTFGFADKRLHDLESKVDQTSDSYESHIRENREKVNQLDEKTETQQRTAKGLRADHDDLAKKVSSNTVNIRKNAQEIDQLDRQRQKDSEVTADLFNKVRGKFGRVDEDINTLRHNSAKFKAETENRHEALNSQMKGVGKTLSNQGEKIKDLNDTLQKTTTELHHFEESTEAKFDEFGRRLEKTDENVELIEEDIDHLDDKMNRYQTRTKHHLNRQDQKIKEANKRAAQDRANNQSRFDKVGDSLKEHNRTLRELETGLDETNITLTNATTKTNTRLSMQDEDITQLKRGLSNTQEDLTHFTTQVDRRFTEQEEETKDIRRQVESNAASTAKIFEDVHNTLRRTGQAIEHHEKEIGGLKSDLTSAKGNISKNEQNLTRLEDFVSQLQEYAEDINGLALDANETAIDADTKAEKAHEKISGLKKQITSLGDELKETKTTLEQTSKEWKETSDRFEQKLNEQQSNFESRLNSQRQEFEEERGHQAREIYENMFSAIDLGFNAMRTSMSQSLKQLVDRHESTSTTHRTFSEHVSSRSEYSETTRSEAQQYTKLQTDSRNMNNSTKKTYEGSQKLSDLVDAFKLL